MNTEITIVALILIFILTLFGIILYSKHQQAEAIQQLVSQGVPALEARCALK